ncbi:hypothetical protein LCGC14_0406800 [marine sediment metagenome]|uniref:Uncharacterized protein n=1 Tax=marine sediment metagenome TaxID=412755 RepID=A0A0F9SV22_9ZZZZ
MTKEMKEYIKECDCQEIQQLWKQRKERKDCLYIPSLSWVKKEMGKKFRNLYTENEVWICTYYSKFKFDFAWAVRSSPRLACIEALKAIINELTKLEANIVISEG